MRVYDLLLRLYPASFRNEYGGEMRALFARRRQQATGPFGALAVWMSTVGEIVTNASMAHLDILRQDVAYAVRVLRRAPGFAITAVAIVALGIGATTAAFSITDFVLIRPLPFPEPDHLVAILEKTPGYPTMEFSAPNYRDWMAGATAFESTGVYHSTAVTMMSAGEPRRFRGVSVSVDLFPTLGVAPTLGRTFTADDDRPGAAGTAILSYRLWQSEFGGDPAIVGRGVNFEGAGSGADEPYTVIGVMPREFNFPGSDVLFWTTNRFTERDYQPSERTNNWLYAVGRLRRGVTLQQATAEMDVITARSALQYPKDNKDTGAIIYPLADEVSPRSRLVLLALSGAAACVLLIACANLANLLLARGLGRRRELAVRTAIGAGRERLVRQLMTESLLLAFAGGAIGIGLAVAAVPLLGKLVPTSAPIAASPSVDLRVLLFAALLTALTGLAFGLVPVLRVGGSADLDGLREGARSGGGQKERLRATLVVAEIVASVVLLVSTGLLIRALLTVRAIDPGFNADGVITMRAELPTPQYRGVAARQAFYDRVLADVRAMPGVKAAGFVSFLPWSMRGGIWPVLVNGDVDADDIRELNNVAAVRFATPEYFDAMGIPLRRGRDIAPDDTRDRPFVAVVSESFVRRYWPNEDPIGRHFTFAGAEREVVGVVGNVRFRGLERQNEPQVYLSPQQVADGAGTFYAPRDIAVRTTLPPATLATAIRGVIRSADPKLPILRVQTLTDMIDTETATRSVQVRVLSAFAIVAFVLAAIGINGLLSFAVSQRVQEIGVRLALGARSSDILSMIVWRGVLLAVAGIVPGVLLAYAAGRSMEALLAGVKPADGPTLAAAVALAFLMTVLGTLAPTLRALRVDPITALRAE